MAARRSETVGRLLLYVAVPGGPGAVRVAADLAQVDAIIRSAQGAVAGAALLALFVGAVLAAVAGRSIARPLTVLSIPSNTSTIPGTFVMASPTFGPHSFNSSGSEENSLICTGSGALLKSPIMSCNNCKSSMSSAGSA